MKDAGRFNAEAPGPQKRRGESHRRAPLPGFAPEYVVTTEGEPELLVDFFYQDYKRRINFDVTALTDVKDHINRVIEDREKQLKDARSYLRCAACLNDLGAVAHFKLLCESLTFIIQTYKSMGDAVTQVQVTDRLPESMRGNY